jgi:PAS domain S-box-containing protein
MEQLHAKPVILIVEDDAIIALDLKNMLHHFSFDVAGPVARGDLVADFLREHPADLVLMDILLEGQMDGIEAAGLVMTQFDIPVVFATAQSDDATIKRASETSPYGFIVKPYNDREIYGTIRSVLLRHSLERAVRRSERSERMANRALRVTSSAGRAILHTDTEDAYLDKICRSIVEAGDFAGAWIGYGKAQGSGGIVPVAKSGSINPGGCGDSGTSLSLNITIDSRTRGVITICAGNDAIDEEEKQLYEGFRSDVEHGIRYFRFKAEKDRAETEIRSLHGFYKNVLEGITDAILVTEADGVIAYSNEAIDRILPGGRSVLTRKKIPDDVPESVLSVFLSHYQKAKLSLIKTEFRNLDLVLSTGVKTISGAFIPRIRDSRYDGMICLFRELPAPAKEDIWRERYSLLSEYGRDGIFFIRPSDAVILEANSVVKEIYGWSQNEMRGMSLYDLRTKEEGPSISPDLEKAMTTGLRIETFHNRKDGSVLPVEINARGALLLGEAVIISIVRDISERREFLRQMITAEDEKELETGREMQMYFSSSLHQIAAGFKSMSADEIFRNLSSAAETAQALAFRLSPVPDGESGLWTALTQLSRSAVSGDVESCVLTGGEIRLNDYVLSSHLFFVVRDAVFQAAKPGGARHIAIHALKDDSMIGLSVSYDGMPFDSTLEGRAALKIMNSRASFHGGRVLLSGDGNGRVVVSCSMRFAGEQR